MSGATLRALRIDDAPTVLALYWAVASVPDPGLARQADEIGIDYVESFLSRALRSGVTIGAFEGDRLIGEIHAARPGPRQFDHVLTDLTIAVHPEAQGRGVGTLLFKGLFDATAQLRPAIMRIELMARSGNSAALQLYNRLGFRPEGRCVGRVRLPDGRIEDDIAMAWLAPA